jgi:hypothetical protein
MGILIKLTLTILVLGLSFVVVPFIVFFVLQFAAGLFGLEFSGLNVFLSFIIGVATSIWLIRYIWVDIQISHKQETH